jgi:hypothetical protein
MMVCDYEKQCVRASIVDRTIKMNELSEDVACHLRFVNMLRLMMKCPSQHQHLYSIFYRKKFSDLSIHPYPSLLCSDANVEGSTEAHMDKGQHDKASRPGLAKSSHARYKSQAKKSSLQGIANTVYSWGNREVSRIHHQSQLSILMKDLV